MAEPRAMHLVVRTPTERVVNVQTASIVAEDATGRFGLRRGHEALVAVLVPGLLAYRDASGAEALVAIGPGLLHGRGDRVEVSVRQAVPCSSLERVREEVVRASAERREGALAMRQAFDSLYRGLVVAMADEERGR